MGMQLKYSGLRITQALNTKNIKKWYVIDENGIICSAIVGFDHEVEAITALGDLRTHKEFICTY